MAHHKGRGVWFGGVHDVEESEEGIDSEFFNQLFAYNIDRNRFFPLTLRRARTGAKKPNSGDKGGRRGRGKADEEELLRNLAMIEGKGNADESADADATAAAAAAANESDSDKEDSNKVEKPVLWEFPHPRFNAQLAVQDDTCFIYGGTYEKGDREFTFDELWSLNLNHLDGVVEIFKRDLEDWQGSEDEADSEDDEEEYSDEEEDEDDEEKSAGASTAPTSVTDSPIAVAKEAPEEDIGTTEEISALTDTLPHPRPFESRRAFYERTSEAWQNVILDEMSYGAAGQTKTPKEIKKAAFDRAEEKWWDCREEIRALEDEQEAAGIGEVVSLADKESSGTGGGVGRRR